MNIVASKQKVIIDNRLKRIANVLLLNASFINNPGLLSGKTGIAIFIYHYSRYSGDKIFEDYAGELIDEIYEEITSNTPAFFSDGLTGIGWGLEYLVRNKFVDADTDEILSEIDAAIYRIRLNTPLLVNSHDEFFSFGHYYISRLCGHKIDDEDLNTLIKKYHLIFMIDECERIILRKLYLRNGMDALNADQLNSIIWFLLETDRLGIFPVKTKKILNGIPEYIENLPSKSDIVVESSLMKSLSTVPDEISADYKSYAADIKQKGPDVNKNHDFSEHEVEDFIRKTWQRLIYKDYMIKYYPPMEKLLTFISNDENWKSRISNLKQETLSLTGLAGLGLGLMNYIILD